MESFLDEDVCPIELSLKETISIFGEEFLTTDDAITFQSPKFRMAIDRYYDRVTIPTDCGDALKFELKTPFRSSM